MPRPSLSSPSSCHERESRRASRSSIPEIDLQDLRALKQLLPLIRYLRNGDFPDIESLKAEFDERSVDSCDDDEDDYGDDAMVLTPSTRDRNNYRRNAERPASSHMHAVTEKRYRLTVNQKIQQLHAAIPSSGTFTTGRNGTYRTGDGGREKEQVSKQIVLNKAVRYIDHLVEKYDHLDTKYNEIIQAAQRSLDDCRRAS